MLETDKPNHERIYDKMLNENIMWCLIPTKSCKKDFESFNTILTGFTISYVQDLFRTNFFEGL